MGDVNLSARFNQPIDLTERFEWPADMAAEMCNDNDEIQRWAEQGAGRVMNTICETGAEVNRTTITFVDDKGAGTDNKQPDGRLDSIVIRQADREDDRRVVETTFTLEDGARAWTPGNVLVQTTDMTAGKKPYLVATTHIDGSEYIVDGRSQAGDSAAGRDRMVVWPHENDLSVRTAQGVHSIVSFYPEYRDNGSMKLGVMSGSRFFDIATEGWENTGADASKVQVEVRDRESATVAGKAGHLHIVVGGNAPPVRSAGDPQPELVIKKPAASVKKESGFGNDLLDWARHKIGL